MRRKWIPDSSSSKNSHAACKEAQKASNRSPECSCETSCPFFPPVRSRQVRHQALLIRDKFSSSVILVAHVWATDCPVKMSQWWKVGLPYHSQPARRWLAKETLKS